MAEKVSAIKSIPIYEIAPLQNQIIRELRRILGSKKVPSGILIDEGHDKLEIFQKLTLLLNKLKEIAAPASLTRFERQSSLENALARFSIKRGISQTDEVTQTASGPIPLCIPNNYEWNASEQQVELLHNVHRSGLVPCNQGLQFLRSITGPVCVVCVVGPARTGKSYLLGQLQGSAFRLGHTMKAETMGIWIGQKAIEHRTPTGEKITLVFLDSEGIGSMDSEDSTDATDNQIFTLSVLLSSLLIYNSKNVPNNTDLEKLHFVSKLSDSIRVRSHDENTREDVAKFKEYSPEFFWLIRDVGLDITDSNDKPVDIKTYLEQKILKNESGLTESAKRRNEIRENIKSFFKSVNAFTLPVPSAEKKVLKNMGKPSNNKNLSREFLVKLDILKTIISEKYHSKKGMNDSLLTGSQLADMLESYAHALNTKGYIPDWQSAWELTVKMAYKRAGEKAFDVYETLIFPLNSTFPCEEGDIIAEHEKCMKEAIQIFRQETLMDPDVEHFRENLKEFTLKCSSYDENGRCCGGLLFTYLTQNKERSEKFCSDTLEELVKNDLEPMLKKIDHQSSYESILSVVKQIEDKYWECAPGPSAGDVFKKFHANLEERKQQIMKTISQLADYNNEKEKERSGKLRMEMICKETELEKERLQRQKEAQAKQHLDEVNAMKETTERKIKELDNERTRAMNEQRQLLQSQHGAQMANLRTQQEQIVADRNRQIQQAQQTQANLNQQIHGLGQQIQQLQNRPPTVIRHRRKRGCSIM